MEFKCDSCKNKKYSGASSWPDVADGFGDPYSYFYCSKNHWDMECPDEEERNSVLEGEDPRQDCEDYVSIYQKVYIMMGLPGSGKTTWAEKIALLTGAIIISRDDIRYMLRHNHNYDASKRHQKFVWDISDYMLRESLQRGFDVIIDQMSLTKKSRAKTVDLIHKYADQNVKIIMVYCPEEEKNVDRRMKSNMKWGDEKYYINLMIKLKKEMESIGEDEYDSLFDHFFIIRDEATIDDFYKGLQKIGAINDKDTMPNTD